MRVLSPRPVHSHDVLCACRRTPAALPQTNADGQSIGQRLISLEPMYLIINLAMANKTWAAVSPSLKLPAVMSVDHVRVWQRPGALNVGCDPPGFATSDWIACHADDYLSAAEQRAWRLGACSSQVRALRGRCRA